VSSRETAVKAEVTLAVNIAMVIRPNMIQMMEKIRATTDFGDLSPYLRKQNTLYLHSLLLINRLIN